MLLNRSFEGSCKERVTAGEVKEGDAVSRVDLAWGNVQFQVRVHLPVGTQESHLESLIFFVKSGI